MKRFGWLFCALAACASLARAQGSFVEAPARTVPVIDHVDVVVVGCSEGGMAAAWRAARLGARVMLLSEYTFLGGGR